MGGGACDRADPASATERVEPAEARRDLEALLEELELPRAAAHGRFLLVAAHPDDETIGATWLMRRAAALTVVHATDGVPYDRALWSPLATGDREAYAALRARETEQALARCGVMAAQRLCLGFVDQELAAQLPALVTRLCALVEALRPSVLVTHAYEGGHPDHDATALAVQACTALVRGPAPIVLEMAGYHRADGALRTHVFLPSAQRIATRRLSAAERAIKGAMLASHASQAAVLAPFGVDEERFRHAPRYDVRVRPHTGELHYESLGWAMSGDDVCAFAVQALSVLGLATQPRRDGADADAGAADRTEGA